MPELSFRAGEVKAMPYTAVPTLAARLDIANRIRDESIQSILLNCQLQIQPLGRAYSEIEEARLLDIFGEREQWGRTMKPLHWTNLVVKVTPFTGETAVDLPLPCSFDFNIAANKYFYGLESGSVSLIAMFSGTVFYLNEEGAMRIAQIPWDREARLQLPVDVWRQAIDAHFPGSAWLRLPRETFDRLYRYKVARGIPMWEDVIHRLLDQAEQAEVTGELAAAGRGRR